MRKTKHFLLMAAMLLCCVGASAATTYPDWTSTNKADGSTSSNTYTIVASVGKRITFVDK